jgi:YfiH family protein
MLRFADCVPILFYDQRRQAIGLAHAGWRGIPAEIIPATVATMTEAFGSRPADIWAGVGPSIGPCCYEVGPEVVQEVSAVMNGQRPFRTVDDGTHLDLWAAVRSQLLTAGVTKIEISELCTACHNEDWFSHRAEKGRTGRFGVVIGLKP